MPPLPAPVSRFVSWRGWHISPSIRGDRLAIAFVILVVLTAFSPAWARGELFYESDTLTYYAPFSAYAAEALGNGALPLWNPYVYMGYPQFADGETGVLFPLHFLALSTGHVEWLLLWGPVIRSLLAALAAYWLARSLRISPAGAALTGLAFGLGSFAVAQQHHLNVANSVFVLPAMLAAAERALTAVSARKRLAWFASAASSSPSLSSVYIPSSSPSPASAWPYICFSPSPPVAGEPPFPAGGRGSVGSSAVDRSCSSPASGSAPSRPSPSTS